MTRSLAWLAAFLLGFAVRAGAQTRPLQTEEATTAGAGRVALEVGATVMGNEPNFATNGQRTRLDAPVLNLVYSPAGNVEIDLAWAGRVVAFDDPDFGTVSDWGDVTLRTKLRLFQDRKQTSAVAVRYVVTLPETNQGKGLGPNTLRMMAQALATKALGSVALHVNAGLAIHDEVYTPHAQNDLFAYGVALEWSATGRLAVLGEVAGRAGKGLPVVERTHEARLGLRYSTPRVAFDAAVRRGLSDSDGDWGLTAGLTWTAKAPR